MNQHNKQSSSTAEYGHTDLRSQQAGKQGSVQEARLRPQIDRGARGKRRGHK